MDFWDERYNSKSYAYGTDANLFFAKELSELKPGKILLPAEGEGRNAVYAAKLGWEVVCFDSSVVGREKALNLAQKENVSIIYLSSTFDSFLATDNSFDCIALIFAHLSGSKRQEHHKKLIRLLKPGGNIILEAFSKEQINTKTGGPKDIDFLFSKADLEEDFSDLKTLHVETIQTYLSEGKFHFGESNLVRLVGTK